MSKEPLYALIFVQAFGPEDLKLVSAEPFNSKGNCEVTLEKKLKDARTHGGLAEKGVRFGGACVLVEQIHPSN